MLSDKVNQCLTNPGNANILLGLERIKKVLELLSNPQFKYQVIHITGTNGKGSTAAFIETGLIHAGYRVGKFSSPYIKEINECITLNGKNISDDALEQITLSVNQLVTEYNLQLSPFEYLTTVMFYFFALAKIDYLVLEVGMGGASDATNVVNPLISIITNISLEHTKFLGSTLAAIAYEKSGIIKGNLAIIADSTPELIYTIRLKTNNYINVLDKYSVHIDFDLSNFITKIKFDDKTYNLSLLGKFQAWNFLCAYEVFNYLEIPEVSLLYAAENTKWPGRLEVINHDPLIMLDATHNEAGARQLYNSLSGLYSTDEVVIITSILADKDINGVLGWFHKLSDTIIYTGIANNPRALTAEDLASASSIYFKVTHIINNPQNSLEFAKTLTKKMILVTGSLYLLRYFK